MRTVRVSISVLATAWFLAIPLQGRAQAQADPTVARGTAYLRSQVRTQSQVGETALIALALLKADAPKTDPDLAACVERIRGCFKSSVYEPQRRGGHDIYEAGVVAMALSNLDAEARRFELSAVAQYLIAAQKANGSWDYTQRPHGDTSISQYAILGLWEAENGGAEVPPQVWDRAASWFMSVQAAGGSWNYHRDEPQGNPETISMTAAGVGSLLICQRQLARYRRGAEGVNTLLTPLAPEGAGPVSYDVQTSTARLNESIRRGLSWLGANFTTAQSAVIGQSAFYGLYGIERIGAACGSRDARPNRLVRGRPSLHRGGPAG
ncbi:MAG: hypothetical protein U0794_14920 [Isosphaeraceae bacterium]